MSCLVCGASKTEKHHIRTRGAGGPDDEWNLLDLCRFHHQEAHKIGVITFIEKYLAVQSYINENGWQIEELFGRKQLKRRHQVLTE